MTKEAKDYRYEFVITGDLFRIDKETGEQKKYFTENVRQLGLFCDDHMVLAEHYNVQVITGDK